MPDNLKELITAARDMPSDYFSMLIGVTMSVCIAVLRVVYDKKETKPTRIVLEGLICGGLTLTAFYAIRALGWNLDWAIVAGGLIGHCGSVWVKMQAQKLIARRIEG